MISDATEPESETPMTEEPTETGLDAPTSASSGAPSRASSGVRRPVLAVVLVLATLVALVCAGWTLRDVRRVHDAHSADAAALAAGRSAAVSFTSYDYRHIDQDLDRVAAHSTGEFRRQFTKALGALTAAIKKAHGVSRGDVTQAGIVRSSSSSAVVIAAVDARITNRSTKGSSLRRYRLQITLERVDGDWLISDISPVA